VVALVRGTIAIWDVATGAERDSLEREDSASPADRLALSPDGRWLAVTEVVRPYVRLLEMPAPPPSP
jgi:hypothetical protein